MTHRFLLIGCGRQQNEGDGHRKTADGVQLTVGAGRAQHAFGSALRELQNLRRGRDGQSGGDASGSGGLRHSHLSGGRGSELLPVGEEAPVEGLGVRVVV